MVDPLVPTAGLGLGLPGLQPGLADKQQMAKAVLESDATADQMELQRALKESQDDELQRAIKESKLSTEHVRQAPAQTFENAITFPFWTMLNILTPPSRSFLVVVTESMIDAQQ